MTADTRPTVRRRDISLTEERERVDALSVTTWWTASLFGKLSTGEHVTMERSGGTCEDALSALESAIEAQGWRLHA